MTDLAEPKPQLTANARKLSQSAIALRLEVKESINDVKQIGAMVKDSVTLAHWSRNSPLAFALTFFAIGLYLGSDD